MVPLLLEVQIVRVTSGTAKDTLFARYNDLDNVAEIFNANPDEARLL